MNDFMEMPLVSVIMPVYCTPIPYLREAIESILHQTYTRFEFIIIDDYSNEDTVAFLNSVVDERIRIIRNKSNLGITRALNIGLFAAHGKYIARMDADDIAVSTRLEKQVRFLEKNPDVIACGSAVKHFSNEWESNIRWPQIHNMEEFRIRLLFSNCGPKHPTIMFNSALLEKYHITYNEQYPYCQDYDMWFTCSKYGKIRVLDEVLLFYREHMAQVTRADSQEQKECAAEIREKQMEPLIGSASDWQKATHERCIKKALTLRESKEWLNYLEKQNRKTGIYNCRTFRKVIREKQYLLRLMIETEERNMPFFLVFLLFAPLDYKIRKCYLVFASIKNGRLTTVS